MKATLNGKLHKSIVQRLRETTMDGNTNMKEALDLVKSLKRLPTGNQYLIDQEEMMRLVTYLSSGIVALSSAQELAMKAQDLIINNSTE